MAQGRYRIIVRGKLGERFSSAFGGTSLHVPHGHTTLERDLRDQSERFGVGGLGLELVGVQPLAPAG